MTTSRRQLLLAAAASLLRGRAQAADEAIPSRMIVRSPKPEDLEMQLDGFADWITPVSQFFVRCHSYTPAVDLNEWRLKIDGLVDHPASMGLDDLKKLPRVELVSVLECAGSGRTFYRPTVAGTQWGYGAVGNAKWTGVRLRDVLKRAGIKESAQHLLCDGADVPLGKMPDFQRTIPVHKALHPDTLLAYEMNGRPLPIQHGFPVRVVAPGWAGDSWVKWLQHIEVLDHEFDGFWMKTAYRHPAQPVAPGTAVDPRDMIPVADLNVKSVIASPNGWARPGAVRIQGKAWSNSSPVSKVEVSTDGGQTWVQAKLVGPRSPYAWRSWEYAWKADQGEHTLLARATNEAGQTQPLNEEWNPSGYLWNVAQPFKVVVSERAAESLATSTVPAGPYPNGYKAACFTCHDEHMMVQQHLTRAQWEREVNKMTGWGAHINAQDREEILNYLSGQFKP
ncbi:MAG TPA: molybdopterin-dependent oxidoreductase [Bryobacteraceae bacterium]|nr:molybdopterin-dependent oxidoreductase [Bryobacteraceae bacterium]